MAPARAQPTIAQPPYQAWNNDGGKPSATFHRTASGYLVRFPGIVDFRIDEGGAQVECVPVPGREAAWRVLFEQQLRPLLLSLAGEAVFHGAAVDIGGRGLVLLGPSGRGKSTLTAALARRGHAFLGDDCLHLDLSGPVPLLLPQAAHVRLWPDSLARLAAGAQAMPPADDASKPRLAAGVDLPHAGSAVPLAWACLLGEPVDGPPSLQSLDPRQRTMAWTANAFVLDLKSPEVQRRNLQRSARLAAEVPLQRLDYRRDYDELDAVLALLLAEVQGQACADFPR